ncbi:MAG: hypothetical protein IGS03_16780 [Candidatus Sericytochromatia bacterium]|nr:hypothetical protein [Candidatus Sericytochromatia bacterium]
MPEAEPVTPWPQAMEAAMVERLKTFMPGVHIEAIPEREWNFTHPRGAVLVMLQGMRPAGQPRNLGAVVQDMTLTFEVNLMSRSMRNHTGLYPMLTLALQALYGWAIPQTTEPLQLAAGGGLSYDEGAWSWNLRFETRFVLVPCPDPDPEYPLIKNISVSNCGEDCESCQ